MERNQSFIDFHILTIPTELLVIIVSYLSSRDRVHLLCVSQRLRAVCETPSLWHEFVWDYYDTREETCVKNMLKRRGEHITRLAFPGYWAPPAKMLQYCSNLRHLSLPVVRTLSPDQLTQLGEAIQHMKHLCTLDIGMFTHAHHLLKLGLKLQELSFYVRVHLNPVMYLQLLKDWAGVKFRPSKLNIITVYHMPMVKKLIENWQQWNSKVPAGHTAWLKIYSRCKTPLNLYSVPPVFQLHFGQTVVLPFVQAKHCGIQGLDYLQLTDCCRDSKIVYMAKALLDYFPQFYNTVNNINCVTHFDVAQHNRLLPNDLEQIAIACPNLQQLKINGCFQSLTSLHGLHAVASYCHNLQGLNMIGISVSAVEGQIQLWEILSKMTLTHLAVDYCIITPSVRDIVHTKNLVCLYQKCTRLLALAMHYLCASCECCRKAPIENGELSLSYFTSLRYCEVHNLYSAMVVDILASCKQLRCYRIVNHNLSLVSLSLAYNLNLQQLFITSNSTVIPDTFMTSVSAHGGLIHVVLSVASISFVGINVLIENSPKLTSFQSLMVICDEGGRRLLPYEFIQFDKALKQKFHHHKVFYTGGYIISLSPLLFLEQTDVCNLWDT